MQWLKCTNSNVGIVGSNPARFIKRTTSARKVRGKQLSSIHFPGNTTLIPRLILVKYEIENATQLKNTAPNKNAELYLCSLPCSKSDMT